MLCSSPQTECQNPLVHPTRTKFPFHSPRQSATLRRMTSARLALTSLLHQRGRTLISVIGCAFAVVLVFMQLGFLGAVENTAALLYGKLRFDILLTSSEYIDLSRPGTVERSRLAQAKNAPGVVDVLPISLGMAAWQNPTDDPVKGKYRWQLSVLGVDPGALDRTFFPPGEAGIFRDAAEQRKKASALGRLDEVLLDELSRPDFGRLSDKDEGMKTTLNGQRVTYAGSFRAGTGFSYTGLLLTNEQTFQQYLGFGGSNVTFGLVQLAPGTDTATVKADLIKQFAGSPVQVFTRDEIMATERDYWLNKTALGQFFYFGVVLAITVGGIFLYQMMVADIKKNLPEYATLKAMGYRFGFLFRVVVWQALYLAIAGYAIGMVVSVPLYQVARAGASLPIWMTGDRLVVVLLLTVGMCVGSAMLAVRKVRTADPADLF